MRICPGISAYQKNIVCKILSAHELWVGVDNVCDALARECLFTEAALDIHQNFLVCRVGLVENILERKI
jgi:hypothetical protein